MLGHRDLGAASKHKIVETVLEHALGDRIGPHPQRLRVPRVHPGQCHTGRNGVRRGCGRIVFDALCGPNKSEGSGFPSAIRQLYRAVNPGFAEHHEPRETPDALPSTVGFRCAVSFRERFQIRVGESASVVRHGDGGDRWDRRSTADSGERCVHRPSRHVYGHPAVLRHSIAESILGRVDAVDHGLEDRQERVAIGHAGVSHPTWYVDAHDGRRFAHDVPTREIGH